MRMRKVKKVREAILLELVEDNCKCVTFSLRDFCVTVSHYAI